MQKYIDAATHLIPDILDNPSQQDLRDALANYGFTDEEKRIVLTVASEFLKWADMGINLKADSETVVKQSDAWRGKIEAIDVFLDRQSRKRDLN